MNTEKLLEIVTNYESRLKYLPTGVKQFLISQILLDPLLINNMEQKCKTNYVIDQFICQNIDLYKMLWYKYISSKPLGEIGLGKLHYKYKKATLMYHRKLDDIINDKYKKKYNILYDNAKKVKQLLWDIQTLKYDSKSKINLDDIIYLDFKNNDGWTPLMSAVHKRQDLVLELLKKGSNPNFKGPFSRNPLMIALDNVDIDTIKLLLKYGADPNQMDDIKETPFTYAFNTINVKKSDILKQLLTIQPLIDYGADVNTINKNSNTVIFGVTDQRILQFLINNNIDLDIYNGLGNTALMELLGENNIRVDHTERTNAIILLYKNSKNIDFNHQNIYGETFSQLLSQPQNQDAKKALGL